ncbi:MAG: PKD domain-containing protein, partial [Pontibacter sp.]|nr:PKD domain-containing protein [Pontibacter sp.]
ICPDNPDGNMWPCIPHATMAHELGHAFGLPHPVDDPLTNPVANHSLMQTHWNYPQGIYEQDWPWGLLTVERTTLWNNPFFYQNISLRQTYDADVVNLPNTGLPPTIRVNYSVSGRTVTFTNNTTDAVLYYWTFGDLSVSNEQSPTHTYSKPGTYTVSLRASSSPGMTALYQTTIEIRDLIADKDKNKPKGTNIGPVKVYPNPNNTGLFYLSYPPVPFALRLTVLHPMGSVLFRKTISDTSQDHQLDLRSYGSGLYILRLEMKGATLTRQLIVN